MCLLLDTSSKPASQTVSVSCESNLIHSTYSPLCCFARQFGNLSKNYFEKEKKKKENKLVLLCCSHNSNAIAGQSRFWLIFAIKNKCGPAPRGQPMFRVFPSPGSLHWTSLLLQHRNTKYRWQMNLDPSDCLYTVDRLHVATSLTLIGTKLMITF